MPTQEEFNRYMLSVFSQTISNRVNIISRFELWLGTPPNKFILAIYPWHHNKLGVYVTYHLTYLWSKKFPMTIKQELLPLYSIFLKNLFSINQEIEFH